MLQSPCITRAAPGAAYRQKGLASRMATAEVLVVDDDEELREIVAECLRDAGYRVYEAPDGQPALERLRSHPGGLVVLLDLMMPGMDGYAVLEALAADTPRAKRHAYILFSASRKTLPSRMAEALQQLNVSALPKPFDLDEMLAAVQTAATRLREPSR